MANVIDKGDTWDVEYSKEDIILNLHRIIDSQKLDGYDNMMISGAIAFLEQDPCEDCQHNDEECCRLLFEEKMTDDAVSRQADIIKFEGTNMACIGGDEIMKEFEKHAKAEPCEKMISLERAKKQIGRWIGYIDQDMINRICMSLDALPSVQPKANTGRWILHEMQRARECSACKIWMNIDMPRNSFCPNCGADMRGEEE